MIKQYFDGGRMSFRKWNLSQVRKFFFVSLVFHFIFTMLHTAYVLLVFSRQCKLKVSIYLVKCKVQTQTPIELWVASKIIFPGPLSLQRFRHRFCSHAGQRFIQLLEKELFGWKMQPASQTTPLNALPPKTNIYLALQASPSWTSENGDCFIPYEEQCKVTSLIISFNFFA